MSYSQIGSLKFHFLAGATAPSTPGTSTEYVVKFPEGSGGISVNVDTVDNEVPVNGILGVERTVITKAALEYSYTIKQFDLNILSFFLGGATPTTNTPPTTITVGSDFAHSGWGYMEWYDNGDAGGSPLRKHTGFSCQIIPEGDFSLDPSKFTELKFKIKITATRGTLA